MADSNAISQLTRGVAMDVQSLDSLKRPVGIAQSKRLPRLRSSLKPYLFNR